MAKGKGENGREASYTRRLRRASRGIIAADGVVETGRPTAEHRSVRETNVALQAPLSAGSLAHDADAEPDLFRDVRGPDQIGITADL